MDKISSGSPITRTRQEDFDYQSGSVVERLLFNFRPFILALCFVITAVLAWQATHLKINASFLRVIPTTNPYMVNLLAHYNDPLIKQQSNTIRVIVEANGGTIFTKSYLQTLSNINQDISALPGVDRPTVQSLWSSTTRWTAVTPDGFTGGTVIPDAYTGTASDLQAVETNIELSGQIGKLVAPDFKSSVIAVPLRDVIDIKGTPTDYGQLSHELEQIRQKYASQGVTMRITGFAKVVGDMINATPEIVLFFAISICIAGLFLFWYTRCVSSTLLVVCCSLIAVVWQLGFVAAMGFDLDPYTELVPFLIFAIGMSHGAQKMNGIMQDIGRGTPKLIAARMTFRRLFMAGFSALVCDAVGFGVLAIIHIVAIRNLAIIASFGVAILIFTNLILLPILLSYVGVKPAAAKRALDAERQALSGKHFIWDFLCGLTRRRNAIYVIVGAIIIGAGGLIVRQHLQVGDLSQGAPELRANSQYNLDNDYLTTHYGTSSDVYLVMATMQAGDCDSYSVLHAIDSVEWEAGQVPGVVSTLSYASFLKFLMVEDYEQNFKWYELVDNQPSLNDLTSGGSNGLTDQACSLVPLYIYLADHRAATLTRLSNRLEETISRIHQPKVQILLAGGSAGIASATNATVKAALHEMLYWVYGAVSILCLIAFRSWRATVCAVLPLMLTSVLAEALMVTLKIGVKVDTLPVVALGVGIGVDYALYVLSIVLARLRSGATLYDAFRGSLMFTGRVVMLTGFTLAASVATWAFAPIKFQADMGVLLSFMFLWNMIGALVLVPALAHFLLKPKDVSATVPI